MASGPPQVDQALKGGQRMVDSTAEELVRLRQRVEQLEGRRRSPATLVVVLALIAALSGGTAWAAATVGTADIKNKAVTTPKLDDGAVTGKKLKTQAVGPAKIALGAVRTAKLADNSVTTRKIANGHVRAGDLGLVQTLTAPSEDGVLLANLGVGDVIATCPAGTKILSGGFELLSASGGDPANGQARVSQNSRHGNGWRVVLRNETGSSINLFVDAYCLQA
jgi:hypothetical protein